MSFMKRLERSIEISEKFSDKDNWTDEHLHIVRIGVIAGFIIGFIMGFFMFYSFMLVDILIK